MTFSILARDAETGALGGAAATGSLCVGGWVLRGDARRGMSASQGASPSTFWGEDVLLAMEAGETPEAAVARITGADAGRDWRQLSALSVSGDTASFTGARNTPAMGARVFDGGIVAGNLLASEAVLDAIVAGYRDATGPFEARLLAALRAGEAAGSDSRGLMSASLLVVSRGFAPLTLRIDASDAPLDDLETLHARAVSGDYHHWSLQVPVLDDPERVLND